MVQLEVLVAVARHHREPVAWLHAELVSHRVGQSQHTVTVLLERAVVVAVVEPDLVRPALEHGDELAMEDELFHGLVVVSGDRLTHRFIHH